jgi:hypothetical protein
MTARNVPPLDKRDHHKLQGRALFAYFTGSPSSGGRFSRLQFRRFPRRCGCIDRLQSGVSSKPVNSAITMMTPFHVENGQRTDGLRDRGLSASNRHGRKSATARPHRHAHLKCFLLFSGPWYGPTGGRSWAHRRRPARRNGRDDRGRESVSRTAGPPRRLWGQRSSDGVRRESCWAFAARATAVRRSGG